MRFIADFHIHSRYSRATSKMLIPELLDYWARLKGINVVGTGDFTHPGWFQELQTKLTPAEPGLFRLKKEYKTELHTNLPLSVQNPVRFLLTAEISTIYKKNDKVRKVHHLIFSPDFETVERIQQKLIGIGANITSDGRPILGLDSRDLLEIILNVSDQNFLVPAHIWTPWFSILGAKSGFDFIEDCYADLSDHIQAVETGLSSDPPMNWMCSRLDKFTLISNSDAHSPEKLGREANILQSEFNYSGIIKALTKGENDQFIGTIEFFPQEGKYHFDGHRKCGICWHPFETKKNQDICPICGKNVTVGVMNRVMQLADREKPLKQNKKPAFFSLIPLKEILSEILGVGPQSKIVTKAYYFVINRLGSEFDILLNIPVEEIKKSVNQNLAEAIKRMRNGDIYIQEGFDGEFGRITVFSNLKKITVQLQKKFFQAIITESKEKASVPANDTI